MSNKHAVKEAPASYQSKLGPSVNRDLQNPISGNPLTENLNLWISATKAKSTSGRGSNKKIELVGIKKLRELILELAVRGKLVPQNPEDEPASELLKKIDAEKAKLIAEGKIKKQKKLPEISEDEKPFELPQGWEWTTLDDVGYTHIGLTYSPKDVSDIGTPVLRSSNIQRGILDFNDLVRVKSKISPTLFVNEGDLLICARNGSKALVGKTAMIKNLNEPTTFGAFMAIYKSSLNTYIEVFLNSPIFRKNLLGISTTTINQITQNNLRTTLLPAPPFAEQHRIVAKVDELMALCDQLEQNSEHQLDAHKQLVETLLATLVESKNADELATNWQRLAEHFDTLFSGALMSTTGIGNGGGEWAIDRLKDTILQLAVMGKLVPQNPEDEPASELLKKIDAEKSKLVKEGKIKKQKPLPEITDEEKPFELPYGWEWCKLTTIANIGTGATPARDNPSYYEPAMHNWVTSGETSNPFIISTKEKVSSKAITETNVSIYPPGTLVIAMYGQGKTRGQITELKIPAGTNQACAAIQLYELDHYHRSYIKKYFLKSYEEIRLLAEGGAQPNLNVGKVSNSVLPLPPLAEQQRIVAKVDELFALCDQLKTRLQAASETQLTLTEALVEQALIQGKSHPEI
jgi:type I restriction enzyme S subunit